ncbi:molybdopterin-dependent oxidoreductase [Nocardioides zeae]|uniref:Molybdopterin-dependent oxidoreductase n=1 Tax=Nocardioides imazamoxiresistens TaxID=3231893 RepID=A0ABU3PUE8_9ACTN|nr:molybdopterin-dependent oxidoreductase [Nocardioides zeae]MDT9592838.1 molybdopterin-dependent oxidoreductase [Nocardioides zeae]
MADSTDSARPGPRRPGVLLAAAGGVLATLVGMAVGHLVASITDPAASPVLGVGSTVIDLTPTPVKEWAVANFGTADKPILIGSVLVVTLLLSAAIGVVAARRLRLGLALLVALAVVAGVLVLLRPTSGPLDVVPAVATAVVGAAALWWFLRAASGLPLRPARTHGGSGSHDVMDDATPGTTSGGATRRGVLIATGVLAAAAAVSGAVGQWVTVARTRIGNIALPKPVDADPPLPDGLDIDGISPFRTPNDEFYRVDVNLSVPVVDHESWTLTVDGDVENELTITFDELLEMDMVERDITMTCVSNDVGGQYVGAARWLGVPLTDILDRAGVGDRADQLLSTAVDGFTISTPLDVATDGRDALVVVGMNGEPLPRDHGFPVRMIIPGIYGYVGSTKWLTKLTLTTYADDVAYWTERDWATDAPVKISSRIDVPKSGAEVDAGEVVIAGVAWAQTRGIAKVEIQIDGGAWTEVELGADAGVDYWRQWFYRWQVDEPGRHSFTVRATDVDGEVQTDVQMRPFPEGSSGLHTRAVMVA